MASTNKTSFLELSQFVGSDKPAWLTDYNGDMEKIDSGVSKNANTITTNKTLFDSYVSSNDSRLDSLESTVSSNNSTLTERLDTTDATLVKAQQNIVTNATNIETLQHKVALNQENISTLTTNMSEAQEDIAANISDISVVTARTQTTVDDVVVPFQFGVDSDGSYGYVKSGADTVTPFSSLTVANTASYSSFTIGTTSYNSITWHLSGSPTVITVGNLKFVFLVVRISNGWDRTAYITEEVTFTNTDYKDRVPMPTTTIYSFFGSGSSTGSYFDPVRASLASNGNVTVYAKSADHVVLGYSLATFFYVVEA